MLQTRSRRAYVRVSRLQFVCLAASNDIRKLLGPNPARDQVREMGAISRPLTAFTNTLLQLSKGRRASYNSSAVTAVLKEALGGNCKTTLIVTAAADPGKRAETIRSMRLATRMSSFKIGNRAKINVVEDVEDNWRSRLSIGDAVDCLHASGLWCRATIAGLTANEACDLQIRFSGFGDGFDEVLSRSSHRIDIFKTRFDAQATRVRHEGFMRKEGRLFKTWRKRYFVLLDGILAYYNRKGDESPIKSIPLKTLLDMRRTTIGENDCGMELKTKERTWKFLCGTEQELVRWIRAIQPLITLSK